MLMWTSGCGHVMLMYGTWCSADVVLCVDIIM